MFLRAGAYALEGHHGTLIQVTGAPARRANPQRGLIAAGVASIRALAHASAQELRANGIHVALLIVDGIIESPKTARMSAGMPIDALIRHQDVINAGASSPRSRHGHGTNSSSPPPAIAGSREGRATEGKLIPPAPPR